MTKKVDDKLQNINTVASYKGAKSNDNGNDTALNQVIEGIATLNDNQQPANNVRMQCNLSLIEEKQ